MKMSDLILIDLFEGLSRDELIKNLEKKRDKRYLDYVLDKMHELVKDYGDRQSIGGYAFDVSRFLGGAISGREIERLYREKYTNESILEWGRIVKGVNTTQDVGTDEIKKQAAKFGNTVDKDGRPPSMSKRVKGKSTNVLYNLGLAEGVYYSKDILIESVIYEGFLDSAKQFLGNKINQTAADIKGAVVDLKSAGVLIKDIVTNEEYLNKVNQQLKKQNTNLIKQINRLSSENQVIANVWNRIKNLVLNFINTTGWKGFLGRLGVYGFLRFIVVNTQSLQDAIIDTLIEKLTDLSNIIPSATMGGFLELFNSLTIVKEYFFDILTSIKKKLDFGANLQTNSKYTSYELALLEGGHTLEETTPEPKKPGKLFTALSNEAFDTEVDWIKGAAPQGASVYAAKVDDAYIEITYKPTEKGVYISFTRGARMSVTGEGSQNKIFGAVINHIKQWVAKNKPEQIVFSAFKPRTGAFGSQDSTRSGLYRKMVQRFANQNGYDYDVEDTGNEDTFILTRQGVEENFADGKITEVLDNPYPINWIRLGPHRDSKANVKLPDGSLLEIDFYLYDSGMYDILFKRNRTLTATGSGDEFRIFATIKSAIISWWKQLDKEEIVLVTFSAAKGDDGKDSQRRNILYKRFAKQFAQQSGWNLETEEDNKQVNFILKNPNPVPREESVEENFVESKVNYSTPNFEHEWEEAERYPEFKKIGKDAWIELAGKGKAVTIRSAKGINNTDAADPNSFASLDKTKQSRALDQLKSGTVEMPIVAVYPDGWKELVGGNTRLTAMLAQNGKATVWVFKVPDEVAELAENFADGKKKVNEALDNPYPISWSEKGPDIYIANSQDDLEIFIADEEDKGVWDISFMRSKSMRATQEGNEFRIFATVKLAIIQWWKDIQNKKLPVNKIVFSASKDDSDGRASLYKRFASMFAQKIGYRLEIRQEALGDDINDIFVLSNPNVKENFADGKKPGRKGLSKRVGIPKGASVTQLRKIAKNSTGERRRMAHWQANMKSGRKKK